MRTVALVRYETGDTGTFGRVLCGDFECHSLELPWRDNQTDISCIKPGRYECRWTWSPKFGRRTYELFKVEDRKYVRIHAGNWAGDVSKGYKSNVEGCILLGDGRAVMKPPIKHGVEYAPQDAVTRSGKTCDRFREFMREEPFMLEIVEAH